MTERCRLGWAGVLAVIAVTLGASATSFACVPQPFIVIHPQSSGAPGSEATVDGQIFDPGSRGEIRWNGTDGPLLATAQTENFSLPVTVPSVPSGLYTVIALTRAPNGVMGAVARAEFQVTTGAEPVPVTQPPTGLDAGADESSADGTSFASVAAAVGLVAIGAFGGAALVARRRPRSSAMPAPVPDEARVDG